MIIKLIICTVLMNYATCRTAKDIREMPQATARLSQAEYPSYRIYEPDGPGTYAFGYEIEDVQTGNVQFRDEEKLRNGTVRGSYGVLLPDNTLHITRYTADQFGYRANSETKKQPSPHKIELQLQPSIIPQSYSIGGPQNPPSFLRNQQTTPNPDPFETLKPTIDPLVSESVYRQHQINLNPTYNPLRDQNVIDEQTLNAILYQQYLNQQYPNNVYGFRQNSDGSVSTSRPPWPFNWFTSNNNNNNNYQSDQPQQGPILSFFNNLAQNNPITSFFNGIQQNDQPQNPFQNFLSNINPLNLFSNNNNNRPQLSPQQTPIQSDYVATNQYASNNLPSNQYVSTLTTNQLPNNLVSNQLLSNNLDSSVFSNDQYHHQNQAMHGGNYIQGLPNPGFNGNLQSVNFNPGSGNPTPLYNPGFNPGLTNSFLSSTHRPNFNPQFSNQAQPYSLHLQNPSSYPVYQNPYQSISPLTITSNPNFNQKKRKTNNKSSKKKNNRNKVDVPDTDSDWFQGFLDKRKEASIDISSRRPTKKKSEDDDDDFAFDDYFR